MQKVFTLLLVLILMLSLAACAGAPQSAASGISAEQAAMLEEAGWDLDEFNEMPEAMRDEIMAVLEAGSDRSEETASEERASVEDASGSGSYVITVSDGLNSMKLHYTDGKLTKIYCSFQKNDEEEPEIWNIEGAELETFHYYSIDYTQDPSAVVADIQSAVGYEYVSVKKVG